MLKVDDYARIRLAHRDGMSIRQIARTFGHSRQKIRQMLEEPAPKPYTLARPRPCRKLTDPFQVIIDEILAADQSAPKKQRHTAKRIFDRLQAEHGFSKVFVKARVDSIEVFRDGRLIARSRNRVRSIG
jgi:transposase